MAENSKIEWCDHTFNPWRGCTKVSPGCANCYAETLSQRNPAVLGEWGKGKPRVGASEAMWKAPLKWQMLSGFFVECSQCGYRGDQRTPCRCHYKWHVKARPRVFCASLADWLDEEVPIEWLARLLELIMLTPSLDWLLLTKRPQNWGPRIHDALGEAEGIKGDWPDRDPETGTGTMLNDWLGDSPPSNVWIGTSVEGQACAEERIPHLRRIPARVRFLSCEPLLGPVDLRTWLGGERPDPIHWVICGGESGPHARPMHPAWARSLRDQCEAASVPFLFKQWGEWVYPRYADPETSFDEHLHARRGQVWTPWANQGRTGYDILHLGKKRAGRLLDGRTWDQFPQPERRLS